MEQRDNDDLRAIVRPSQALQHFTLDRWEPDASLKRFVGRFWKTSWDLPEPFTQSVLGFPAVNFVVQSDGSATITGVLRTADERTLVGDGWAFGTLFRPAGFRPFVDRPMSELTDRRVDATEVFGADVEALAQRVLHADDDEMRCFEFGRFLEARAPVDAVGEETIGERVSTIVEEAGSGDGIRTNVSIVASTLGVSVRTLQRMFLEHIGVGPKFVLQRYRQQAAAEAARQPVRSWADVAQQIGYADQAHLTKEFSATFGASPAAYARNEIANSSC